MSNQYDCDSLEPFSQISVVCVLRALETGCCPATCGAAMSTAQFFSLTQDSQVRAIPSTPLPLAVCVSRLYLPWGAGGLDFRKSTRLPRAASFSSSGAYCSSIFNSSILSLRAASSDLKAST